MDGTWGFDEQFYTLWQLVNERYVDWSEFSQLPMPQGVTASEAWEVIGELRRRSGFALDRGHGKLGELWVNLPMNAQRRMRVIIDRTDADSHLSTWLSSTALSDAYVQGRVSELALLLQRNGDAADYETLRSVVLGTRRPRKEQERLAAAFEAALNSEFSSPRPRTATVEALYGEITGGAPIRHIASIENRPILVACDLCLATAPEVRAMGMDVFATGSHVWSLATELATRGPQAAFLGALILKAFFIRSGFGCIALLPLMALDAPARDSNAPLPKGDITSEVLAFIEALGAPLALLERSVLAGEERLDDLRHALESTPRLNYRQREIALRALRPGMEAFDYENYVETFQVAYNTARSDLSALVADGLLSPVPHSKKSTFAPAPNFASALETFLFDF